MKELISKAALPILLLFSVGLFFHFNGADQSAKLKPFREFPIYQPSTASPVVTVSKQKHKSRNYKGMPATFLVWERTWTYTTEDPPEKVEEFYTKLSERNWFPPKPKKESKVLAMLKDKHRKKLVFEYKNDKWDRKKLVTVEVVIQSEKVDGKTRFTVNEYLNESVRESYNYTAVFDN